MLSWLETSLDGAAAANQNPGRTETPPRPRPPVEAQAAMLSWLETSLDGAAAANQNPGRTETLTLRVVRRG